MSPTVPTAAAPLLASADAHAVDTGTTLVFAAVLVALIVCLALEEKIHAKKSFIAGTFAMLSLLMAMIFHIEPGTAEVHVLDETLTIPIYIPAIDWGVIAIILGSSLFVDVTSKSGLFTWIAIRLTKASAGDPVRLLWFYGLMTVGFSAVLNNVTAMIIVGSLTGVSLRKLERESQLLGFLLIEGLLTNIGGLLTLISSVPNIIVGTAAGISFVGFFVAAAPFVVLATVVTLLLGGRLFGIRKLSTDAERAEAAELVSGFDENDGIESRAFFQLSWALLAGFIAMMSLAGVLPYVADLGMGFVALGFAIVAMLRYKSSVDRNYQAMDWDLLFFFIFLFVVINVMEHAGVLGALGGAIGLLIELGDTVGTGALLVASALASAVTDNVPLAAVLGKILAARDGITADSPLWWACIFGANLGGNFTPIGSASTVVAVAVMHKHDLPLTFVAFVKKALPFALMHVLLALVYVLVVLA